MSGDSYQHALDQLAAGEYNLDYIRVLREGVLKGEVDRAMAINAVIGVMNHQELVNITESLEAVVNGKDINLNASYLGAYVNQGILDKREVELAIEEGVDKENTTRQIDFNPLWN